MHSVLNKLSEYIYFTYQKTLIHRLFCLFLKLLKAFSESLIQVKLNRSSHQRCSVKKLFLKNRNIFRKTPVLEHLSNKVTGVQACSIIKKRPQPKSFSVNIAKFFRTLISNICEQLLIFSYSLRESIQVPLSKLKRF